MPALQPEKFPKILERAYGVIEYMYASNMTSEAVLSHLTKLQSLARSMVLTSPDGEAHEASKRFLELTKKLASLYKRLTESYITTRNHQFDSLGTALDAITKAVPEARAASLHVRVARVRRVLSDLQ